jgi:hypothetical protein
MADENWVGFARSPKPDLSLQRCHVAETLETELAREIVFQKVTSAEGLSSWLNEVSSADAHTSGKITFVSQAEQTTKSVFSLVDLGRKVVINSEVFGEISLALKSRKQATSLEVSFTKMVSAEQFEGTRNSFLKHIDRLAAELGVSR